MIVRERESERLANYAMVKDVHCKLSMGIKSNDFISSRFDISSRNSINCEWNCMRKESHVSCTFKYISSALASESAFVDLPF